MAIAKITELVRRSYSDADAVAYETFVPDRDLLAKFGAEGTEVLRAFPTLPGACAVMSALYAVVLQDRFPGIPIHVAAGALVVDGATVFGETADQIDWNEALGQSNPSWDGHCWVVCGDWIADISICRTAYSSKSSPILAEYVRREFGENRGLIIQRPDDQLRYEAYHVLTEAQVTGLGRGAMHLIGRGQ
jgi:hypothetical protein